MSDEFNCLICIDVCRDAVATNCCHQLYCQECVSLCTSCPNCRHDPITTYISVPVRRIIGNQKVICDLCSNNVTRYDLDRHNLNFCEKRLVKCTLCSNDVAWNSMDDHMEKTCPENTMACPDCSMVVKRSTLHTHQWSECRKRLVTCHGCKNFIPLCDRPVHRQRLCPNRKMKCDLCEVFVNGMNLQGHIQERCPKRNVTCSKCSGVVQAIQLRKHVRSCQGPEIKVNCRHCDAEILENNRVNHEKETCRRRPVACFNCGDTVPWEDQEDHALSECSVMCGICYSIIPIVEYEEHTVECMEEVSTCTQCSLVVQLGGLPFSKDSPCYRDTLDEQMAYHKDALCSMRQCNGFRQQW